MKKINALLMPMIIKKVLINNTMYHVQESDFLGIIQS